MVQKKNEVSATCMLRMPAHTNAVPPLAKGNAVASGERLWSRSPDEDFQNLSAFLTQASVPLPASWVNRFYKNRPRVLRGSPRIGPLLPSFDRAGDSSAGVHSFCTYPCVFELAVFASRPCWNTMKTSW